MQKCWFLGLVLLLLSTCTYARTWNLTAKNYKMNGHNTLVYVSSPTTQPHSQPISVVLTARKKNQTAYLFQKSFVWKPGDALASIVMLNLPEGEAVLRLSVTENGHTDLQEVAFYCHYPQNTYYVSDVFLSHQPFVPDKVHFPFMGSNWNPQHQQVYFYQQLNAPVKILTTRAILYKQNNSSGNLTATTYLSLAQINQVLSFEKGSATFSGKFTTKGLGKGAYLVELFVYDDIKLLAARNIAFEIAEERPYFQQQNLTQSIAQLSFILPQSQVDSLLRLPDTQKKAALIQTWETLYPKNGQAQAILFYDKILSAQQKFQGEKWQSDRVRTYVQYGEPDEIRTFRTHNGVYEGWKYKKWELAFVFKNEKGVFRLKKN